MNKITKRIVIGALAAAAYLGTFRNNSGFPLLHNDITKNSYGICIGFANQIRPDVTYKGLVLGLININAGKINGGLLSAANTARGRDAEINGLEVGLISGISDDKTKDLNSATRGIQIGLANGNRTPEDCLIIGSNVLKNYNGGSQ